VHPDIHRYGDRAQVQADITAYHTNDHCRMFGECVSTMESRSRLKCNSCLVEKFSGSVLVAFSFVMRPKSICENWGQKQQSNSVITVRWFDPSNGEVGTVGALEFGSTHSYATLSCA
jgi:hypothetical protein